MSESQKKFNQNRETLKDPLTGVQIRFGVMGSAEEERQNDGIAELCYRLGYSIAEQGCCLLTGACPGLPQAVVVGSKEAGGHTIGISPAASLKEHVEVFHSPYQEYDVMIFTGFGLMGRELINIRSSDIVIIIGGRSGTLGEFAIAYEDGKLIGVLTGTGGITTALPQLEASIKKNTGAQVIYEASPEKLVELLLERYLSGDYVCPCHPQIREKIPATDESETIKVMN